MHPVRKQRLLIVCFIVVFSSVAAGLVTYGLRGNINLFFPPSEIVAGKAPIGQNIRLGGMVVDGSLKRSTDSLRVEFEVTDNRATVGVVYEGILPDLFGEGQGVVAAGKLDESGVLQATEVLAKHDENYMPPEVIEAMKEYQEAES
ncbi:cytochrome c maturation protein CcmE [Halieaceae bacterium IMCC14734]|uniref:Cytochrome c-type biogenesis protein CcmE n=1 Tax=Candidatus Litorirhabdus singularis TaxID=2518993 RepID=A0ABT3TGQ6_9GAMM|nr:cytochrome c maturation protein CcmE [Candidatus Litorirhabdus singularis]MCX2981505.1 cytochrome c maturation protein CcmE [Candidatus Litorirhabdus singularis]